MMVIRDIWGGVRGHFASRVLEWVMAFPAGAMALGLYLQPDLFETGRSFRYLIAWGNESVWMMAFLACYVARLFALTINGTFRRFRFSPHIRVTASMLCMLMWSQFALGFAMSFSVGTGGFTILPGYITMCIIEGVNIWKAASDIRVQHDERNTTWTRRASTISRR